MLDIIKSRRSIRKFLDTPVSPEDLTILLEAARWAPSGGNKQPWQFIAVRKAENIRKIKMFSPGIGGIPTALIIICSEEVKRESTTIMDIAIAAQNIMLAATDKGLGSCCVESFDQKAVRSLANIPSDIVPELIIALGYPAKDVKVPKKRQLEEMVHWEEYGGKLDG